MGFIFHYLNQCIALSFLFSISAHFSSFKTHIRLFSSTKMFTVAHFNKQNHIQKYLDLEGTLENHLFPLSHFTADKIRLSDLCKVTH